MNVAIASGKGGTGKTTVSAALATIWPRPAMAVDLDVEEPNLHLFLNPEIKGSRKAYLEVPQADESKCDYCRACAELCQFKAISVLSSVVMIFSDMCHGCGGCMAICPNGALSPSRRELGEVVWGQAHSVPFLMGRSRVGEAMSPPLMREVKAKLNQMLKDDPIDVIIDAPPGVSCPAVNAVMDSDVIILVTEPTPFGLYDLKLAHQAFAPMGKPMGIVVNRAGLGDDAVYAFAQDSGLPVWCEIPYSQDIAKAYADGRIITDLSGDLHSAIAGLAEQIQVAYASAEEVCHA
jgi:MinD superfamily P-loop ATPase